MDHIGESFIWVLDAAHSGALLQSALHHERAEKAGGERELAWKEKEDAEIALLQEQEQHKQLERE